MAESPQKRVVMIKRVARKWVARIAHPEYRFRVLLGAREIRNLPGLLRSFRDGKITMGDVPRVADLGIKEGFDSLAVWSKDREGLLKLSEWFEKRGFETTGVW